MREPPDFVSDAGVLDAVRAHWRVEVDAIEHLPVGFGAHHWMVSSSGEPRLFVTLDRPRQRQSPESLESAYGSAAALAAAGLEFVWSSMPNRAGKFTAPLAGGMVSCTRWLHGTVAGSGPIESDWLASVNAAALARLQATQAPKHMPVWQRLVDDDFCDRLEQSLQSPWTAGPYGERARRSIAARIADIRRWTASYHRLCRRASDSPWVPTHGEPHTANQVITESGVVFVDWETVALAPRERDLRTLVDSGYADLVAPDWAMIAMFDLEWRLDELSQYSTWFAGPHRGSESDRVALAALFEELDRPDVFAE